MNEAVQAKFDVLFSHFSPEERGKILAGEGMWKRVQFSARDMIFKEGAKSDELYLMVSGQVEIAKHVGESGGQKKVLALLGPGEVFGEGALLSDKPRSANAVAILPSEMLRLSKHDFDALVAQHSGEATSLLLGLLKLVNQRLLETNQELVTLYDVAQIVNEVGKGNAAGIREGVDGRGSADRVVEIFDKVAAKLESVTAPSKGLIAFLNRALGRCEVQASWGEFSLTPKELQTIQVSLVNEALVLDTVDTEGVRVETKRFVVAVRDLSGHLHGFIIAEREGEWPRDMQKVVSAIADQLGIAFADIEFMESEKGRTQLAQYKVNF